MIVSTKTAAEWPSAAVFNFTRNLLESERKAFIGNVSLILL
ncbi:MAG: hypothetical protein BSOLF_2848 [Candidatus Carbobacillus altaicus]|uniref:Uncharacterized protein n=1 Tax=Candidatus Carbonibacillus altaicus TaxID=2163959 RepID=A0A2R6XXT9_9BACL|nr:MAG: hypothetical protein BSOLF_2848 [Candidatus Carbobacillus altaicus]